MKAFSCSIDMTGFPQSKAKEIQVKRTGDNLFWCTAVLDFSGPEIDLGPVVLGFDGVFTDRWNPQFKALVGGEDETTAFFTALRAFLKQGEASR